MFGCLRPGCPVHCGTRRRPGCIDRMLFRALFLMLAGVLIVSLVAGLRHLRTASAGMAEPAPLASAHVVQLVGQAQNDAR